MIVEDLGLIEYDKALETQLQKNKNLIEGKGEETLLFCSHPPVVTLGRGTKEGDVFSWEGSTIEVSRGGRATYHGPSQVVVYPIISLLKEGRQFLKVKDIHSYLRNLELAVLMSLEEMGVSGAKVQTRTEEQKSEGLPDLTGVWVGELKVASMGVAVKRWCTYHGIAVNIEEDPRAFSGINPCGFRPGTNTSLEAILGREIDRPKYVKTLEKSLLHFLS